MARGQLIHVRIAARDPGRAARFYAAVFGWRVLAEEPAGVRFAAPGGLEGTFWRGGEPSSAGAELYVEVVGIEAVVRRAVELGGLRIARVGPGPGGARLAQLLDTEGNRVGVWEAGGGVPEERV
jgi:hypothetical protein